MLILALIGIVIACLIIWRACDGFEAATSYLGRNLSDGVRGATFNAIGSSLPELLTASLALLFYANKEGFAFGIGTTAGSAMFNSTIIPALVMMSVIAMGLTTVVTVSRKVILRDGLCLLGCELALIYILTNPVLDWHHGLILIGLYFVYMVITFSTMKRGIPEKYDDECENGNKRIKSLFSLNLRNFLIGRKTLTTGNSWLLLLISTTVIGGACHLLVESCYTLGDEMGIKTYFIAIILAAAATSVPDTIISIKDARKGDYDDAVANALGSNIFDICVCLGLPLLIYCIYTGETISISGGNTGNIAELRVLLFFMTAIVFIIMLLKKGLSQGEGVLLLLTYFIFIVFILARASNVALAEKIGIKLQYFLQLIGG